MKELPRFFIDPEEFSKQEIALPKDDFRHAAKSLRLKEGDRILALDGLGQEAEVKITGIGSSITGVPVEKRSHDPEPYSLGLFQGYPKGEKFHLILEKAVELGVNLITPVITEFSIPRLERKKTSVKENRWRRIIKEAAQQSRRNFLPQITPVKSLEEIVEEIKNWDCFAVLWEKEKKNSLSACVENCEGERIAVLVGPEGGLSDKEIEKLIKAGAITVSLGESILRTETAAIAAMAISSHILFAKGK